MVIKEKELARLMKDAYRGGGYTVAVRGNGKTVICANAWAVEIDDASLPREALSMIPPGAGRGVHHIQRKQGADGSDERL